MFFMLLLNFGFDDDDCCDDSSIENAVYMARRRTVRCGARTRTDRVGRYMLVYDCRRAGVVPARTTLARANDAVLFPAETDDRARQWRDHRLEPPGNVFPFSPVFFFVLPTSTSSCRRYRRRSHRRRHHFATPHKQLHEHTRARTPHVVPIILLCTRHAHGRDSRESPR